MTTDIVTVQEGKARLSELEGVAGKNLHNSKQFFAEALLALDKIREEGVWVYALDEDEVMLADYVKPQFKRDYLYRFCRKNGVSMSSVYDHLATLAVLQHIGWDNETIIGVGVREAKPIRTLIEVDGRTGEFKIAPQEVIDRLPPGDTPLERIRAKANEVFVDPHEPLSPADAFRSFAVDAGGEPEVYIFESGDGDVWMTFSHEGESWDGVIIPTKNYKAMSDAASLYLVKKLKIKEYPGGNNGNS